MMSKHTVKTAGLIAALAMSILTASVLTAPALAAEEDIPKTGVVYTLTYPDGHTVTKNDKGDPLSYEDVTKALQEDNWRLLGSDYTSDKNGRVELPASWEKGTIRIVETKVPDGYKKDSAAGQTAELSKGSVKIVNQKDPKEEPGEDTEPTPEEPETPTPSTPTSSTPTPSAPTSGTPAAPAALNAQEPAAPASQDPAHRTGDTSHMAVWPVILLASAASLVFLVKKRRHSGSAGSTDTGTIGRLFLAAVAAISALLLANSAYAATGFVINKVDDSGDPVKGAVFAVYGKPEVSWKDVTPAPCRHDPPVEKKLNGDTPAEPYEFSFTMRPTDPSYPMVPGSADGVKTVTVTGPGKVEFGTITFTKEGTYDYIISEDDREEDGFTYDDNKYTVRYKVENKNGKLEATRTFLKNGSVVEGLKTITFENTYTAPEMISISGTKTWDDADDQDGRRPDQITVRLHADGAVVYTQTVREGAGGVWKYEFADKPKYRDGKQEIVYTVTEDAVENYTSAQKGFDFTNRYTPGKTAVSVSKEWDDADDRDAIRPGSVTVKLLADRADTGKTLTLNAGNDWKGKFENLSEYKDGKKIVYSVEEKTTEVITGTDGPGTYAITVSGDASEGFVITNKHTSRTDVPEQISISGTKTWPDGGEPRMGWTIPDSITVKLQKKVHNAWTDVESKTVSKDAATGKWTYTFEGQPKHANGAEIEYRVVEEPVAGYKASGGTKADDYNLTNEYDERTITLTKTWKGDGRFYEIHRPGPAKFATYLEIYRNDELLAGDDAPTPNAVNNGNHTYTVTYTVPKIDENGTEYEYKIEETNVPYYVEGEITGSMDDGFAVTNTYETVEITVHKIWVGDEGNEDKRYPSDPTYDKNQFFAELFTLDDGNYEIPGSQAPTYGNPYPTDPEYWHIVVFSGLPKYYETGSDGNPIPIDWKIREDNPPEGYTSAVTAGPTRDENGNFEVTFTNTYNPSSASVNINVGMTYRVYSGGSWGDVVATPQEVTISEGALTENKTLTFTPGSEAQEVTLPGAGTYTIAMKGITKNDLKSEDSDSLLALPLPLIIDTVSATVIVDEDGNCTVDSSSCTSFAFGADQGSNMIYNDIDALKEAYLETEAEDRLDTLNPHSPDAGATASGNTVTLTTVISEGWGDSTDIFVS